MTKNRLAKIAAAKPAEHRTELPANTNLPDFLWQTQFEGTIWVSEMSDRHLLNAFALLTRRLADFKTEYETIQLSGDDTLIEIFYERLAYFKTSYNIMAAHVKARNLSGNPLALES